MAIDNAKLYEGTIELNSELRKLNLSYERLCLRISSPC